MTFALAPRSSILCMMQALVSLHFNFKAADTESPVRHGSYTGCSNWGRVSWNPLHAFCTDTRETDLKLMPGGLTTLKTLLEASTPERPIEACLFEA